MITPQEARKLNEIDQKAALEHEARIDRELSKYDGQRIAVDMGGMSGKMVTHLKARYEAHGWRVEIRHGDQSDPGPHMWFSEK